MSRGRISEALEVLKLSAEAFPGSFQIYDSMGEVCMKKGDKKTAVENYKKSLELNPDDKHAKEMLKKERD